MALPYFDATQVRKALPFDKALVAMESALRNGIDPENESPRLFSGSSDLGWGWRLAEDLE